MKIKNWKRFNESNLEEGAFIIKDILMENFIDNGLCEVSGNDTFMRFEFHNESDFNDAKETLKRWDIGCWTSFNNRFGMKIISYEKSIEDFIINKLSGCDIVDSGNYLLWKKNGVTLVSQDKYFNSRKAYLPYEAYHIPD